MIPYNELRIGNYVLVNNLIEKVALISHETSFSSKPSIVLEGKKEAIERQVYLDAVQPVLLTDNILRQCGFVFHDYFKFWQLIRQENGARSEMDIDRDFTYIDFMRRPIVKNLKSLHQLQNLYFSFMGSELTFTKKAEPFVALLN